MSSSAWCGEVHVLMNRADRAGERGEPAPVRGRAREIWRAVRARVAGSRDGRSRAGRGPASCAGGSSTSRVFVAMRPSWSVASQPFAKMRPAALPSASRASGRRARRLIDPRAVLRSVPVVASPTRVDPAGRAADSAFHIGVKSRSMTKNRQLEAWVTESRHDVPARARGLVRRLRNARVPGHDAVHGAGRHGPVARPERLRPNSLLVRSGSRPTWRGSRSSPSSARVEG